MPPTPNLVELWRNALQLHGAGKLAQAAALYDQVLTTDPNFSDAYGARAVARLALGRPDLAVEDFDRLIALEPDHAEGFSNRGVALSRLGRLDQALASFEAALAIRPDFAEAINNRSDALNQLGRFDQALISAQAALGLNPRWAAAHHNRGVALAGLGRREEALAGFSTALACDPGLVEAHFHAGLALMALERTQQALAAFEAALALSPGLAPAHYNRGNALFALGRFEAAAESFAQATRIAPRLAQAHDNLGLALAGLDRLEEAVAAHQRAIDLAPDRPAFLTNLGLALTRLRRFDEAMAVYDRAQSLRPGAGLGYNRALIQLLQGDFEPGWRGLEQRGLMAEWRGAAGPADTPVWRGETDIAGKTLFVGWEQGLGDTIQFCRFLNLAQARGARVVFSCQDALQNLVATLEPGVELIGQAQAPDHCDYQISLMSLPLVLGVGGSIPARPAYLRADPARAADWRIRLGDTGFRIGVAWRGSAAGAKRGYGFELGDLAPLAAVPGVRLISLQKLDGPPPAAPMPVEFLGPDFDAGPQAFADTAAVMQGLDLVVTPDTAIAHLAGALGVPTFVALSQTADWRWLLDRDDSPWYPSLRLFRQSGIGDWPGVFAAMAREIEGLTSVRRG